MILGLVMVVLGVANVVLLVLVLRELRRSARQSVAGSSQGQPVPAAAPTSTKIEALPARKLTVEEQAEWDRKQKHRILSKLAVDFPGMTTAKREAAADELLAKARSVLARAG